MLYNTADLLIVDPPNKGHNRNNLSIKDASQGPKCSLSHSANTFSTSKERTTSLQRTKWLVPTCSLFRGSTVHVYTYNQQGKRYTCSRVLAPGDTIDN